MLLGEGTMTFLSARAVALAKLWLFSFVLTIGLLAPGVGRADGLPFSRIVVFGDSLSDPGNAFFIRQANNLTPFNVVGPGYGMVGLDALMVIPPAPYAAGGNRFSNGPTWIEDLGTVAGLGADVKPALSPFADARASNYAVGGARASDASPQSNVPLSQQVAAFLNRVGSDPPHNALYVIAIGGNDIRDALNAALDTDPLSDPNEVIGAALDGLTASISRLYWEAGARKVLIWNAPDLGRTPAIQRLSEASCPPVAPDCIAQVATSLSEGYNGGFAQLLQLLPVLPPNLGGTPDIEFIPFNAFGLLEPIQARPQRYRLTDATTPCIEPYVSLCRNPDRFFFWDGIHPTRAGHAIIAFLVGKALVTHALQDD
jgi:phospholipase/lecithinase/hemolysin